MNTGCRATMWSHVVVRIAFILCMGGILWGPTTANADTPVTVQAPEVGQYSLEGDPYSLEGDGQSRAVRRAADQWALAKIRASSAQAASDDGDGGVVAVLDTGIDLDHPWLRSRIASVRRNFVPGRPSWDASDVPDGALNHQVGHGTFVAGLILQVAPDARIMPIRVLNGDGVGTDRQVADGIRYAVDRGADIINLSLGMAGASSRLQDALEYAAAHHVVVIASAGNSNQDTLTYPADSSAVIAVAATDAQDRKAPFSNFNRKIRLSAPGVDVYSTYWNGGWAKGSGTSFAAALVSGAAALVRSEQRYRDDDALVDALLDSAKNINSQNPQYVNKLGRGRLDAREAISEVD